MPEVRKLRFSKLMIFGSVILSTAVIYAIGDCLPARAESHIASSKNELFDEYFFTSDGECLNASANAIVTGSRGALVEQRSKGNLNVISGTLSISTKGSPVTVTAATYKISIPAFSTITVRSGNEGCSVSANSTSNGTSIGIVDSASFSANLAAGDAFPQGEAPIAPIIAQTPSRPPLFVVGNRMLIQPDETAGTIALASGQILMCPTRDLKIKTPLGSITAPAQSRFLISVSEGVVRIYNCRGQEMRFAFENKYRRIPVAEEFSVFDHRPTQDEVLPVDGIGRKEITLHDIDGKQITAATTTFSVLSLLTSPKFLGDWRRRSAFDKKIERGFLKAAAALSASTPNNENFYQTPGTVGRPDSSPH